MAAKNTSDYVYEQILKKIIRSEYPVGERLPSENELTKLFDVSRVTVRAAIQKLSALGIIETTNGQGSFVRKATSSIFLNSLMSELIFKPKDIWEMLEFRKGIESIAAWHAASRVTDEEIKTLDEMVENMKRAYSNGDKEAFSECDFELHNFIAKISKNSLLEHVVDIVSEVFHQQIAKSNVWLGMDIGYHDHLRIIDAIKRKKPKAAAFYTEEHLDNVRDLWFQKMEEPGFDQNIKFWD